MPCPTIAVIGASADRSKFGNKCVRAYSAAGYQVYPVNPRARLIEGHAAYAGLAEIPVTELHRISVYLPPSICLQVLPQLKTKPAREIWLNPGAYDAAVLEAARRLGLDVILGCSIVDIGANPHVL